MGFQSFAKQINRLDMSWEEVSATIWWLGPEMTRRSDVFGPKIDRHCSAAAILACMQGSEAPEKNNFGLWDPLDYSNDSN